MICAVCDTDPLTHLWQIDLWTAFSAFSTLHLPEQVVDEDQSVDKLTNLEADRFGYRSLHLIVSLWKDKDFL